MWWISCTYTRNMLYFVWDFLFITILGDGIFLDVHKIIIIVSAFVVYLKLSYEVPCGTIQNPIPNGVKVIMAKELKHYCQIGIFLLGGVSILNIDMGYFAACGVIVCGYNGIVI